MEFNSSTEREQVSASVQTMLRDYAAVRWPSLNHKGRVARLADHLGFGHRRVKSLYHNELGTAVRADELHAVAALRKGQSDAHNGREEGYRLLEARIAALETLLAGVDAGRSGGPLVAAGAEANGPGESLARRRAGN